MNGADWALLLALVLGAVIGWRMGIARLAAFTLGFSTGIVVDQKLAADFSTWILHLMEKTHSSFYTVVDAAFVAHFFARIILAVLLGIMFHLALSRKRIHWKEAFTFDGFRIVSGLIGAVNGTVIVMVVACEVAILLTLTMTSAQFDHVITSSSILSPAARVFHLQHL